MRLALATLARLAGGAIDPEAVRTGPALGAPAGRTSRTRLPSSRNVSDSGKTRRFPCRSSSSTTSFSQLTTAPQKSPALSSTTRPGSAATSGGGAGLRDGGASTFRSYRLLRTVTASVARVARLPVSAGTVTPPRHHAATGYRRFDPALQSLVRDIAALRARFRGRIQPDAHDHARGWITKPLAGRYPAWLWLWGLAVAVAPGAAAGRTWRDQLRQVRDGASSLIDEIRREHNADPAIQLGLVDPAPRVLLTQQRNDPLAVGVTGRRARLLASHCYCAGLTTTADPYATISVSC